MGRVRCQRHGGHELCDRPADRNDLGRCQPPDSRANNLPEHDNSQRSAIIRLRSAHSVDVNPTDDRSHGVLHNNGTADRPTGRAGDERGATDEPGADG